MAERPAKTDLAVIGAGPGGYAAAFLAADLGMQVTLIDRESQPGGVCLYRGCIPSKALLHVAGLIEESRRAAEWGVSFGEPKIDAERLRAWKQSIVGRLTGGLGTLRDQRGIETIRGTARLLDAHTLAVQGEDGERRLAFGHAILATGSRPATIPGMPDADPRVWDSTAALELDEIPRRLLVVGGGYIGLELGTVYAALGSRVTVVEMTSSLLPGVDADLVRPLSRRLAEGFEEILLDTRVARVEPRGKGLSVSLEGKDVRRPVRTFDRVLVAVGRVPNTAGLGLETTRVRPEHSGFVGVDEQRRTEEPSLFAIGDVAGQPMLAHKASHEGRVAAEAIAGQKVAYEPSAVPAVVFTDPEIAWCGLTESEAREQGKKVATARFPWAASGRALTLGRDDGLTKLVLEPQSGRVLGVGITGPGAGELIGEGVLAVEMAALASDLELSIHPHPTLSETLMEAAGVFLGRATHLYRPKRAGRARSAE